MDALRSIGDLVYLDFLAILQRDFDGDPRLIYALLSWMNIQSLGDQALDWLTMLDPSLLAQIPVAIGVAETYLLA